MFLSSEIKCFENQQIIKFTKLKSIIYHQDCDNLRFLSVNYFLNKFLYNNSYRRGHPKFHCIRFFYQLQPKCLILILLYPCFYNFLRRQTRYIPLLSQGIGNEMPFRLIAVKVYLIYCFFSTVYKRSNERSKPATALSWEALSANRP